MAGPQDYFGCFKGDGEDESSNWKRGLQIARGINTQVLHVKDVNKLYRKKCAVKQGFISDDTDVTYLQTQLESELKALQTIKHHRILEFIGYSKSNNVLSLFLPYMEKGSLAKYIKSQDGEHLTEEKTALFTSQILEGLDYLHKQNIIHRDIKASNILMKNEFEIKISDFGVAKILNTFTKARTAGKGTTNWMAPEIIREEPHNSKADIWSLGCTVYQMITGKVPFTELTDVNIVKKALENELQLSFPDFLSPNLKDFLNRTCMKDPADRPNASELMQHNFIIGMQIRQQMIEGQGEVDLHTQLADCENNPSHKEFVPINQLSVEHFPSGYRENDLCELTKALADLTVRIAVKLTSPDRPEFVPGTDVKYPSCYTRGQNSPRTGTGRVEEVTKYTQGMKYPTYRTCPCPECDHSDTPSKVWWRVVVLTARHVVFNESEARQSSCRLWFDDDESRVVDIYGSGVGWSSDTEGDWCQLYCVTHDVDVAGKLEEIVRRFEALREKVNDKYKSRRDVDKLTIIVSHPHGCSKQVSVGQWVHRKVVGGLTSYTFTNCTCLGSGGATVFFVGHTHCNHLHSGTQLNGLNYSTLGRDKCSV